MKRSAIDILRAQERTPPPNVPDVGQVVQLPTQQGLLRWYRVFRSHGRARLPRSTDGG